MREYLGKYPEKDLRKAINKAIERCIREDVLREFLIRRRGEVTKVTQLDYTFDRRIELEREEAREEERVNTERERKRAEEERQAKDQERQAKEQERQRAEMAEKEVQKLRAELEQYKRQCYCSHVGLTERNRWYRLFSVGAIGFFIQISAIPCQIN